MRAEFENGGVMMFGVRAETRPKAYEAAEARITGLDRTAGLWVVPAKITPPWSD